MKFDKLSKIVEIYSNRSYTIRRVCIEGRKNSTSYHYE